MKMLLHLMGKDLRHARGQLIFFSICLLAALSVPLVQRWTDEQHWSAPAAQHFASLLMVVSVMMGLLVAWIHLDHPRDTTGFLQTRPLSPVMRWLPKFLCWALFLLLPVLVALLLQLLFYRLDLSTADYVKFVSRAFLRITGAYGVMALIAVLVRNHRLAALLCLAPLIFTFIQQGVYTPLSFYTPLSLEMAQVSLESDLTSSRSLVAQSVLLMGGFCIAGLLLARFSWRSWLPASAGLVSLSLLVVRYWPWDVIGHEQAAVKEDRGRVAELEKSVKPRTRGKMYFQDHFKREPYRYLTDRMEIKMPAGSLEMPLLMHQTYDPLRLADGTIIEGRQGFLAGETGGSRTFRPYTPVENLQVLLGHGGSRQTASYDLSGYGAQIQVQTRVPLPDGARARLAGRLDLAWSRPVLLADLPLEPGAFFSHRGRSVKVIEVKSFGGLYLKLLLTSFYRRDPLVSFIQQEPEFQIFAAHPERREITTYGHINSSPGITSSLVVNQASVTVRFQVIDASHQEVKTNPFWAQKARLYILKSENIGRGSHSYEGEVTVSHPKRKSKP